MYAAHDAFHRDLRRLAGAVEAARTAEPAVRAGWATLKNQLHVHHTAEDEFLWPALRAKVTQPGDVAVLDAMEAEHARIDPLLSRVDASLAATDGAALVENTGALARVLAAHMEHEENQALPLIEAHLGPAGWAAFRKAAGKSQGLKGGAELFPWMLDGAPAGTSKRVLGMLPPPARLLYRAAWRPRYARTPRWNTAVTRPAQKG
jgi:iron-sulfur cluster repair protein YtfE (RIC family)